MHGDDSSDSGGDDSSDGGGDDSDVATAKADEIALTPSAVFGILATKTVRFILYLLTDRSGTVSCDELATHVAAWENETKPELLTKEMKERVTVRLYHSDIPNLVSHGIVDTTPGTEAVTVADRGAKLTPYLEFAYDQEREEVDAFLSQCKQYHE